MKTGEMLLEDIFSSQEDRKEHITLDVNNLLTLLRKPNNGVHELGSEIVEMRYGVGKKDGFRTAFPFRDCCCLGSYFQRRCFVR